MPPRRLLILDDDPTIGRTISFIAESIGIEARYTASHVEFFALQQEWSPTHVAVDLVMPDMDGVQVLAQLASRRCDARVIITSGLGDRVLAAAGRSAEEHGLDIAGVLAKPFSPVILRNLLGSGLPSAPRPTRGASAGPRPATSPQFAPDATELARALAAREIQVFYQPKVRCSNLTLSGFEALARWIHPIHGLVPPDRFIPLAESHGLIGELTGQVVDIALDWFARFGSGGGGHSTRASTGSGRSAVTLSINLSAKSLRDAGLVERIETGCRELALDPARLILELTETSAMEDPTASLDLLTRFRLKGFQLSLDDFGTGYSSMVQLVRLPFSEIKVDKSFVMSARHSSESRTVIKSVVDLGHSLGLQATAEGVEDAEALEYLNAIGCDHAQGYFFARPMPAEAVEAWVAGRQVEVASP